MYYVLRIYSSGILPSVVFETSDYADALIYAGVMERNDERCKYIVVKEAKEA